MVLKTSHVVLKSSNVLVPPNLVGLSLAGLPGVPGPPSSRLSCLPRELSNTIGVGAYSVALLRERYYILTVIWDRSTA